MSAASADRGPGHRRAASRRAQRPCIQAPDAHCPVGPGRGPRAQPEISAPTLWLCDGGGRGRTQLLSEGHATLNVRKQAE